MNIEAAIRT